MICRSLFCACISSLAVWALVVSLPLAAQESATAADLFFESVDVNIVNIEVMVTDEEGRTVTGLEKEDFEVFEEGKRVEVTNFFAVERQPLTPSKASNSASPVASAGNIDDPTGAETRRLFLVVYIDLLNSHVRNRNKALRNLRGFLGERLQAEDRVMIATFDGGLHIAQNFTRDLDRVASVVGRLERATGQTRLVNEKEQILRSIQRTRLAAAPTNEGSAGDFRSTVQTATDLIFAIENHVETSYRAVQQTCKTLERFSASLAGLPGRKAILYLSDGIPSRPGEGLVRAWTNKFERWANGNNIRELVREMARIHHIPLDASSDFRRMVEHASVQRVAFYPLADTKLAGSRVVSAEIIGADSTDGAGAYSRDVAVTEGFSLESSLLMMADGTGGLPYTRSSNLAGLLDQVVSDFSTFYSLGYEPPSPEIRDFRRVEVKVLRDGLKARHVKGYQNIEALDQLENRTLSSLLYDYEENPLDVSLAIGQHNQTASGQFRVPLLIKIPFEKLALLPLQNAHSARVWAFVIVQDQKGELSPFQRILLPIEVPADRYGEAMQSNAAYWLDLVMEKGQHRIAVGVRDELAKIESTIRLELTVGLRKNG